MKIILIAFLLQSPATDDFKGFFQNWKHESENQWEVVATSTQLDIWSMRKKDLNKQAENAGKDVYVWMEGLHVLNKNAKYNTTKMRALFSCGRAHLGVTSRTTYLADGSVYETSSNYQSTSPVAPGTIGAVWYRLVCPDEI